MKRLSMHAHIIIPDCISCIPRLTLLDLIGLNERALETELIPT